MANYMPISIRMFLCLVLLSSHACNARPFGAQLRCKKNQDCVTNKKVLQDAPPISLKEVEQDEENSIHKLSTEKSNLDEKLLDSSLDYDPPKTHPPPPPPPLEKYVEAESDVSVLWRVPHKKIKEKQPEFHLDYEPPRTHPPIHN